MFFNQVLKLSVTVTTITTIFCKCNQERTEWGGGGATQFWEICQ